MKKKVVLLLLALLLTVLMFCGCDSTPEAPSESKLKQDLLQSSKVAEPSPSSLPSFSPSPSVSSVAKESSENDLKQALMKSSAFFDYFDADSSSIDEFVIEKRQTRLEDYRDTVWVRVSAKDESKSATLSYIMSYVLYNDGWRLEDLSRNMESIWEFVPLRGPSDEIIKENIPADAASVSSEANLEESSATATYTFENNRGYCITTSARQVIFNFSRESGVWAPVDNRTLGTQNDFSPIEGTVWQYLEATDKTDRETGETIYKGARLEIDSINSETLEASGSLEVYRAEYPYGHSATNQVFQGGYEIDLADVIFRFEGESLIMVKSASDESKYKHIEFINEGDGNFSVMVCPRDDNFNKYWEGSEYYLEKIQ